MALSPKQKNPDLGTQAPKPQRGVTSNTPSQPPTPLPGGFREADLGGGAPTEANLQAHPQVGKLPEGKPVSALTDYGLFMPMSEVNNRVDQITAAHLKSFGYDPSPGLIFDVLKAEGMTGPINYNDLFGIPRSKREAQAMLVARQAAPDMIAALPVVYHQAKQLAQGIQDAVKLDKQTGGPLGYERETSNLAKFFNDNWDQIQYSLQQPGERKVLTNAMQNVGIDHAATEVNAQLQASMWTPHGPAKLIATTIGQIAYSTVNMPFGFYQMSRALGLDAFDLSTVPMHVLAAPLGIQVRERPEMATHSINMGHRMVDQVIQDVMHPKRNSGYLVMDIWAAATLGAGIAGKAGRVGAIARDSELGVGTKVGRISKAIIFKEPPAASDMGMNAYQESLPLSDTTIVRVLQEHTPWIGREARQSHLEDMYGSGFEQFLPRPIDRLVSTPDILRRARDKRLQIAQAIDLSDVSEMQRLARWSSQATAVVKDIVNDPSLLGEWRQLATKERVGVEKAIQLVMTDDVDPVGTWRAFHEKMIDAGQQGMEGLSEEMKPGPRKQAIREFNYSIAAHKAQLSAIDFAEKVLNNPSERFKNLLRRSYQVAEQQQAIKMDMLGLPEDVAENHLAAMGVFIRGQHVVTLEDGTKAVISENPAPLLKRIASRQKLVKTSSATLSRAKGALRLHPDRTDFLTNVLTAQKAYERHSDLLAQHQRALARITAKSEPLGSAVTPETVAQAAAEGVGGPVNDLRQELGLERPGYFPTQPEKYRTNPTASRYLNKAKYGVSPPNFIFHTWTGDSLKLGDFRWDISNLLAEHHGIAYRTAQKRVMWHDLWSAATKKKVSDGQEPIRDIKAVPDKLREVVQAIERSQLNHRFAEIVSDEKLDDLQKFLYPTRDEINAMSQDELKHIRWVDPRLIMDQVGGVPTNFWQTLDKGMNYAMGPVNEPMRLLLVFAVPAYALNALGAIALQMIHEGPLMPDRLFRAFKSHDIYGPETTHLLDRLAGNTFTSSLVSDRWAATRGSQALMEGWQKITDLPYRRGAAIHELKRHGFLDENKTQEEMLAELKDPANLKKVSQAAQSARKAMLDFNSLSWPERATLRHLIFVYSFVRAAPIWSLRFLRDHGILSDTLAQAGRNRKDVIDQMVGKMPDWFMRSGYFAVQPDVIYNPIQWNMTGMLEQEAYPLSSIWGNAPYTSFSTMLGPAVETAMAAVTGVDAQGTALPNSFIPGLSGNLGKALSNEWDQTPLGQIATKQAKVKKQGASPYPAPPVRSGFTNPIDASLRRERAGLTHSVFAMDGWYNQMGLALFRSALTRHTDAVAGAARYWRDLRATNPQAYHRHEMQAVMQMIARQQKVVGENAPPEVIDAVQMISRVSQAIEDYKVAHKGEPTPNQKTINQVTINTLAKEGLLKDKQHWLDANLNAIGTTEIKAVQTSVLYQAGGRAWKTWVDRVNTIDNYAQPKYDAAVQTMKEKGLGDYTDTTKAPTPARWNYGRQAEGVLGQAKQLYAQIGANSGDAATIARQKWLLYVEKNDHEIKVRGKTFPSPFMIGFMSKSDSAQQKALATWARERPENLTGWQMQLLTGDRPDTAVAYGWGTLATWMLSAKEQAGFGHVPSKGERDFYLRSLMATSPAFRSAVLFSEQPLAKRLQTYSVIKSSPNAGAWNWMLNAASAEYDTLAKVYVNSSGKPIQRLINEAWKGTYVPVLYQAIEDKYGQKFLSELGLYSDTKGTDPKPYVTKFLDKLVQP